MATTLPERSGMTETTWLSDLLALSYLEGLNVFFEGPSGRLDREDAVLFLRSEIVRRVARMESILGWSLQGDTVLRSLASIEAWTALVHERTGVSLDMRAKAAAAHREPRAIVGFLRNQPPVLVPVRPEDIATLTADLAPSAPDAVPVPLVAFQGHCVVPHCPIAHRAQGG
jgi:hypothetical protein